MPFCPKCGLANDSQAIFCQACGSAIRSEAPAAPSARVAPISSEATAAVITYGGFWQRALAWFIDLLVVGAATGIIVAATFGIGVVVVFFGGWLYEAFMTSSEWQATIGKRALGLVVTDTEGRRLSFGRATGRHFGKWLSSMTMGIGYIIAAFTEKKQGLHDIIAGTFVVDRQTP